ncbi:MAG: bifunctional 2-polyprenyl-6-hydroxyphenol methylase/3-demethylubiquinol 3-O-methyltransferase UbiG, partial [Pseudomonadota bacterium]
MVKTIENDTKQPVRPSIDADEVAKFTAIADEWWDPKGKFRPLHKFNPTRLGFIRDKAEAHFGLDKTARQPLKGLRLLDIGCGGGLVSEPMARLGASVTGIDASEANIKTALTHAKTSGLDIDYRAGTVEGLLEAGEPPFDIVLNLEVVEHVANPADFLTTSANLLAPGGLIILATLNRTAKAFALAIVGAEYVLGWLPRGTHEWNKF